MDNYTPLFYMDIINSPCLIPKASSANLFCQKKPQEGMDSCVDKNENLTRSFESNAGWSHFYRE